MEVEAQHSHVDALRQLEASLHYSSCQTGEGDLAKRSTNNDERPGILHDGMSDKDRFFSWQRYYRVQNPPALPFVDDEIMIDPTTGCNRKVGRQSSQGENRRPGEEGEPVQIGGRGTKLASITKCIARHSIRRRCELGRVESWINALSNSSGGGAHFSTTQEHLVSQIMIVFQVHCQRSCI
jgi:hypothetical protein